LQPLSPPIIEFITIESPTTRAQRIILGVNETPQYVYLDDSSAHQILLSSSAGIYTPSELGKFWPFDFDANGRVG
jgi:hypothetical protein